MKSEKAFTRCIVPLNGRQYRGFMVECGHCGVHGSVPMNTFKNPDYDKEAQSIRAKLQSKGWLIGKRPAQHRCPGCYSAIKIAAKRKSQEVKLADTTKLAVVTAPTRQMTREDRRIIFEKLNEVYADEKTGYSNGWTDAKIADDLGVPRAWVATIRDENFGPEGSNEDIRAATLEAKATLAECRKLAELFTPLLGRADKIEKTLVEIERSLK